MPRPSRLGEKSVPQRKRVKSFRRHFAAAKLDRMGWVFIGKPGSAR
jgi:hypothetical protein